MLASLNAHERDSRITFDEPSHTYTIDGSREGYVSVTSLKKDLFEEFNADAVISKMFRGRKWSESRWFGMDRGQIKEAWEQNRNEAAEAGTAMHLNIERFYNSENYECESKEWQLFTMFRESHPDLLPYRTEMLVFDEDVKVAGSIDLVCRDPSDEEGFLIYDWKRSKSIHTFNTYSKGCHKISRHLDDCNFNHYSLQLATYRHLLQTKYGMKVNGCCLVVLHPEQEDFIEMETDDMQDVVQELWKQRTEQNKENVPGDRSDSSRSPNRKKPRYALEEFTNVLNQ